MTISRLLQATALAGLCTAPAAAIEIIPIEGRLAIGATGVHCMTEPCPWLGVVELDNEQRDPVRPLWSGKDLPKLRASPADEARIRAAWDNRECLEVEGAFYTDAPDIDGAPFVQVHRIVGACS